MIYDDIIIETAKHDVVLTTTIMCTATKSRNHFSLCISRQDDTTEFTITKEELIALKSVLEEAQKLIKE